MTKLSYKLPKNEIIIEDPLLEPFLITRSKTGSFNVYEKRTNPKGTAIYLKPLCFSTSFATTVRKVIVELANQGEPGQVRNLREYLSNWDAIAEKVQKALSSYES
jgi:hypothetical protein